MWLTCTVINVLGNNYYMVKGALMCGSSARLLTCVVITTIWWRGAIMCGPPHMWPINMHRKVHVYSN